MPERESHASFHFAFNFRANVQKQADGFNNSHLESYQEGSEPTAGGILTNIHPRRSAPDSSPLPSHSQKGRHRSWGPKDAGGLREGRRAGKRRAPHPARSGAGKRGQGWTEARGGAGGWGSWAEGTPSLPAPGSARGSSRCLGWRRRRRAGCEWGSQNPRSPGRKTCWRARNREAGCARPAGQDSQRWAGRATPPADSAPSDPRLPPELTR